MSSIDRSNDRLQLLAEFRYHLRQFLQFSERAAVRFGLQPQQHQLLLVLAGAEPGVEPTIGYATGRLSLRHNTVVELSKRCEASGLITRKHSEADQRRIVLEVTPHGQRILGALSEDHALELNELGPQLIKTLTNLQGGILES